MASGPFPSIFEVTHAFDLILAGWLLVVGLLGLPSSRSRLRPRTRRSALVALSMAGQGDYGTIKGRLVWGGSEVPASKNLVEKGKALKDPEVCAKDQPIPSRELVVDPKTKGVAFGFAYLVKPKGPTPTRSRSFWQATQVSSWIRRTASSFPTCWRSTRIRPW